jgi:hypothetical protein
MIKKAKKMGGNAILFEKPKESGIEGGGFYYRGFITSGGKLTYLYKGAVVVFE